ncbi:barstar family protein [Campylobacter sp. RM12920]|uniref:Barstar family protein n=1 Tax=Campylobacter californiensis TaxID=1032243 RepID=A0ABD4JHP6_9BACT|nr:barstar family protein [Campylobacter sp. RM12919]MBE2988262.1 barstar family protein [Campylobacter sp. RM12920]
MKSKASKHTRYVIDASKITDKQSLLSCIQAAFFPHLNECAKNLDAFWDELNSLRNGKILIKNAQILLNTKDDFAQNMLTFLNALKDEGWKIKFKEAKDA